MSSLQKIIKYIEIGFAFFLIVNIFSGIIFGIYCLGNIIGLTNSENFVTEDLKIISSEVTNIENLKIELGFSNLQK